MVALHCPDPLALAEFYGALTGEPVMDHEGWPAVEIPGIDLMPVSGPRVSFSRVENYVAPTWPEGEVPKQLHLDFVVDELDEGEALALSLGATKPDHQPGEHFRVFLDLVGHPSCLIDAASFE